MALAQYLPPAPTVVPDTDESHSTRDLRLDFLRGYAIAAMMIDHLSGPSWLYALTLADFYTSAAEWFVLLAGVMVGMGYGAIALRQGIAAVAGKALRRAGKLYLLTIGVTFPLVLVSELLTLPWATGALRTDPWTLGISILTLHRTYTWIDVMVLYVFLIVLGPVALQLLLHGRTRLLLAGSWGLWGVFQFAPAQVEVPWPIVGNDIFHFASWQVIFCMGMVAGYHRKRVGGWFSVRTRRVLLVLGGLGYVGLAVAFKLGIAGPQTPAVEWFNKAGVGPGRILGSLVVYGFLFLLLTTAWRPAYRSTGWLFIPLGQNALFAYTVHIGLLVLRASVAAGFGATLYPPERWLNSLVQLGGVLLLWLLVSYRAACVKRIAAVCARLVPTRLTAYGSPR